MSLKSILEKHNLTYEDVDLESYTFGTEKAPVDKINKAINEIFDMKPKSIVDRLDLLRPIYAPTSAYGHFGRPELNLPWERTDKAAILKKDAGI